MSALVRHRISLFGKINFSQINLSKFPSFLYFLYVTVLNFSVMHVGVSALVLYVYSVVIRNLYLYVQERMLQQLLTVCTFWHGHWMLG